MTSGSCARNGSLTVAVLATTRISTVRSIRPRCTVVTAPAHGTATGAGQRCRSCTRPPPTTAARTRSTYTVRDNDGPCPTGHSTAGQFAPVAVDDRVEVRNVPMTISVLANDSDSDGTLVPGSVTIVTSRPASWHAAGQCRRHGDVYVPRRVPGNRLLHLHRAGQFGRRPNVATVTSAWSRIRIRGTIR